MFCVTCGKELPEESTFCTKCGQKVTAPTGTSNAMLIIAGCAAVVSIMFALLSIFKDGRIITRTDQSSAQPATSISPFPRTGPSTTATVVVSVENANPTPTSPAAHPTSPTRSIVDEAFVLEPRQYRTFKFNLDDTTRNARLAGFISASGGGKDDVYLLIVDEQGLRDFVNGNDFDFKYRAKVLNDKRIAVDLPTGTYYAIISNAHAKFYPKSVEAKLAVEFD